MTISYGGYYGGDPRRFFPDEECCTPAELAAHKAACEAWNRGERPDPRTRACSPELGCERPYGIGVTDDGRKEEAPEEIETNEVDLDELDDEQVQELYSKGSTEAYQILRDRHAPVIEMEEA